MKIKQFLLLFLITINLFSDDKIGNEKKSLSIQKIFNHQLVENDTQTIDNDNLEPPFLSFLGKYQKEYKKYFVDLDLGLSKLDEDLLSINFKSIWSLKLEEKFKLGLGINATTALNLTDNKNEDYAFKDHTVWGYNLYFEYFEENINIILEYITNSISEEFLDESEDIDTKINHDDLDIFYHAKVNYNYNKFLFMIDYLHFIIGDTKILSKNFGIVLDSQEINRKGIGIGYKIKNNQSLMISYFTFSSAKDSSAFIYQVPRFFPNYFLAQNYFQLEYKWEF